LTEADGGIPLGRTEQDRKGPDRAEEQKQRREENIEDRERILSA
jgi:hypothetical protein